MNITLLSVSDAALADVVTSYLKKSTWFKEKIKLSIYNGGDEFSHEQEKALQAHVEQADFILIDLMGASRQVEEVVLGACQQAKGWIVTFGGDNGQVRQLLRLGKLSAQRMGMGTAKGNAMPENMYKMLAMAEKISTNLPVGILRDVRNYIYILKYWKQAGESNLSNMLDLLAREYGQCPEIKMPAKPEVQEQLGIYDFQNEKVYATLAAAKQRVLKSAGGKPLIILLFHAYSYPYRIVDCVAEVNQKLSEFAQVVPIVIPRTNQETIDNLINLCQKIHQMGTLQLIISFLSFRLGAGPMGGDAQKAVDLLEQLNVPVLHPLFVTKANSKEWQQSKAGLTPGEFLVSIMLPELDGSIEMMPIGGMDEIRVDHPQNFELRKLKIIPEQLQVFIQRVKGWLMLQSKENKDKRVAFICYNYPPGEENIFGGAFLDTFASMAEILQYLQAQGYNVPVITVEELKKQFIARKLVNSGRWNLQTEGQHWITYPVEKYLSSIEDCKWTTASTKQWGSPPGGIMTTEQGQFLIPGLMAGNIFVGLQPTRGIHENNNQNLHSKTLSPHHQYIAFYRWLKEIFKADIIIHVGTHGTLEFLPGKECGLSAQCLPDALTGNIPHSYLYYVGNPAEAMIAKRRGRAVLVSYQSSPFIDGQLYGEYEELYNLIQQFSELKNLNPKQCHSVEQLILAQAKALNLPTDIEEVEEELYRMRRSLIPQGLHVFGQGYTAKQATDYMQQILRYEHAAGESLRRVLAEDLEYDYEKLQGAGNIDVLGELDTKMQQVIQQYVANQSLPDIFRNPANKLRVIRSLKYGLQAYYRCLESRELTGLEKILSGQFLPAQLGGDSMRNPDILPTGFNMYQFDPRLIPSQTAYVTGAKIGENTIQQYWQEHGNWPQSTAVVLWGLETARTHGETIGQILYYLGVRPLPRSGGLHQRYEIIPLTELGRPRIDVVISMCGFFRDMFPNVLDDLNYILTLVANLEEDPGENLCKAHTDNQYMHLRQQGYEKEVARDLATARIFGPERGAYGTGVRNIIETRQWDNPMQLAEDYIASLRYVYSQQVHGQDVTGLLENCLKKVDIVSQTRSSHEYEVIDLDHYYEFFGGLAKSVEKIKGRKAQQYISDTTGEQVRTEDIQYSIERGVRTRLLNPQWIDGLLQHDYHGVQKIADRFKNILGLAATTDKVEQWIFQKLYSRYVDDESMRQRMLRNNPWAYGSCLETLLECEQRGYWQTNANELRRIKEVYLKVEGKLEEEE